MLPFLVQMVAILLFEFSLLWVPVSQNAGRLDVEERQANEKVNTS